VELDGWVPFVAIDFVDDEIQETDPPTEVGSFAFVYSTSDGPSRFTLTNGDWCWEEHGNWDERQTRFRLGSFNTVGEFSGWSEVIKVPVDGEGSESEPLSESSGCSISGSASTPPALLLWLLAAVGLRRRRSAATTGR
jgi:MYXO-CTERM domain-containing protein